MTASFLRVCSASSASCRTPTRDCSTPAPRWGLDDVERLLRRVPVRAAPAAWQHEAVMLQDGMAAWLINPSLSAKDRARCQALAAEAGVKVVDLEADPKLRGVLLEEALAERHRTIRWHFA